MKTFLTVFTLACIISSCNIKQKQDAELPEVDVDVDAGKLPKFDIDWADVKVGTKTKTVKIPKAVIVMEEEQVEVPYIDIDMPNSKEKEELTITVEAEVSGKDHVIDIKEILATKDKLYVISELKELNTSIGNKKLRVSDRVIINAPDLNIKHIIVGDKPDRFFNSQYTYIAHLNAFKNSLDNPQVIYKK